MGMGRPSPKTDGRGPVSSGSQFPGTALTPPAHGQRLTSWLALPARHSSTTFPRTLHNYFAGIVLRCFRRRRPIRQNHWRAAAHLARRVGMCPYDALDLLRDLLWRTLAVNAEIVRPPGSKALVQFSRRPGPHFARKQPGWARA